jgi:hypothetical protein
MNVAFLVLAHRGPAQLGRLAERLLGPGTSVYVHIDRRTDASLAAQIEDALPRNPGVHLLPRVRSAWSSWGPVRATLRGLAGILESPDPPEHVVLLSGQDYPLRPAADLAAFFAGQRGRSFVPSWPMPSRLYDRDGGMYRLRYWHAPLGRRRAWVPIPRRYPRGLRPYGGSAFMALDRDSAREVLAFSAERPDVVRFHRHIWAPDEHFIHTVLHNSRRRDAVVSESLWHIEWPPPPAKHPALLREEAFPRLEHAAHHSSEAGGRSRAKLFARKFDADVDAAVLDRIDDALLRAAPSEAASWTPSG